MRISDWSSDVCSSDLPLKVCNSHLANSVIAQSVRGGHAEHPPIRCRLLSEKEPSLQPEPTGHGRDRKSVVSGKSVSVRVDLGGRRIIKKKMNIQESYHGNTTTQKMNDYKC